MLRGNTAKKKIAIPTVAKRAIGRAITKEQVKAIKVEPIEKKKKSPQGKGITEEGKKYVKSVAEKVEQAIALQPTQVVENDEGRPLFDGKNVDVVLAKLESAFQVGATDEEACMQADISMDSLYRYERKNPEFRNRKHLLKTKTDLAARATVAVVINERDEKNTPSNRSLETSKWHLERKVSKEYAPKQLNGNFNIPVNPLTPERIAQIESAQRAWDSTDDEDWEDEDFEVEK